MKNQMELEDTQADLVGLIMELTEVVEHLKVALRLTPVEFGQVLLAAMYQHLILVRNPPR